MRSNWLRLQKEESWNVSKLMSNQIFWLVMASICSMASLGRSIDVSKSYLESQNWRLKVDQLNFCVLSISFVLSISCPDDEFTPDTLEPQINLLLPRSRGLGFRVAAVEQEVLGLIPVLSNHVFFPWVDGGSNLTCWNDDLPGPEDMGRKSYPRHLWVNMEEIAKFRTKKS